MLEIKVWLVIVLCIELPAIGYVVIHSPLMKLLKAIGFDWFMAVGIYMLTAGLFVQIGRTHSYLNTNKYPIDEWFPMWVLKDIGGSIMVICVIRLGLALLKKTGDSKCVTQ